MKTTVFKISLKNILGMLLWHDRIQIMQIHSAILILVIGALYGAAMKLADLFDEHDMRWFKGDAIVSGFLWGIFGALLVLSRQDIANFILAMVLTFILRMLTDYRNHAIADVIIILAFAWKSHLDPKIFLIFFFSFIVFGCLKDYLGNIRKKHDWIYKVNEPGWLIAVVPPFIYALVTGNWLLFGVSAIYFTSYNLIKYSLFYLNFYSDL